MIGLVTGGFDPLHSGHMEYLRDAKKLCSHLVVGEIGRAHVRTPVTA